MHLFNENKHGCFCAVKEDNKERISQFTDALLQATVSIMSCRHLGIVFLMSTYGDGLCIGVTRLLTTCKRVLYSHTIVSERCLFIVSKENWWNALNFLQGPGHIGNFLLFFPPYKPCLPMYLMLRKTFNVKALIGKLVKGTISNRSCSPSK